MDKDKNQELLLKYSKALLQDKLPIGELECEKSNFSLHEITYVVSYMDDFIEIFSESSLSKSQIIAKLCELIVGFGLVNTIGDQEREYNSDDFPLTAKHAEDSSEMLKVILSYFEDLESTSKCQIIVNILLLCATHNKEYAWSSEKSIILSADLLTLLLKASKQDDLSNLLCGDDFYPTIFKRILKKLRPSLLKDTWLLHPSSCHIFSWLLQHIKHPYLSDYLSDIFPPPCMFVSDFQICHRVLGIKCFDHILDNVPPTLIKLDGKEEVIFNLLLPYTYVNEEEIVAVIFPCLLKLPSIKYLKLTEITWSHFDQVFDQLLFRTDVSSTKKLTLLYLNHIYSFIKITPPLKHLKFLIRVVGEKLQNTQDVEYTIVSLKIYEEIIKSCWPCMKRHCFDILKNIVICLCQLEEKDPGLHDKDMVEINKLCKECFDLLQCACKEEFQNIVSDYIKEDNLPGVKIFKSALQNC